jgi:hypothetical protein
MHEKLWDKSVDKLTVGEMSVGEMAADEMAYCREIVCQILLSATSSSSSSSTRLFNFFPLQANYYSLFHLIWELLKGTHYAAVPSLTS